MLNKYRQSKSDKKTIEGYGNLGYNNNYAYSQNTVYNPYTNNVASQNAVYNPYTNNVAYQNTVYNPYTNNQVTQSTVYNPYTNNQVSQYTYDVNGNLVTDTTYSNGNLSATVVNVNGNNLVEIVDANGNLIVNQTFFFNCSELPSQYLIDLCANRSASDPVYAQWIQLGVAWWFTCYPTINPDGFSWESQPNIYPLPMWWWKYPEIPAPSQAWLNQNFVFNGVLVPKYQYYSPPAGFVVPTRIDLRTFNPDCVQYQNQNIVINTSNEIIGVQDIPVYTNTYTEGFDGGSADQSYISLFCILIIVVVIIFFLFYRHKTANFINS